MKSKYADFTKTSKIPLTSISLAPIKWEAEKKTIFFTALDKTLKGLSDLYRLRNQILTTEESAVVGDLGGNIEIPSPPVTSYLSRPDGFCFDDGTYKLIEMNYGNSMGGILALYYLQELYNGLYPSLDCGNLARSLVSLWKPYSGGSNKKIIAHRNCGNYERYEQQNIILCEVLKGYGLNISFMDIKKLLSEIKDGLIQPGLTISRQDILDDSDSAALILDFEKYAESIGIAAFNPVRTTDIFNSKILLALYSEYMQVDTVVDSLWLGNQATIDQDKFIARRKLLIDERENFVIKRDFSYQGKHIVFGDETGETEWKDQIQSSIQDGRWIAQRVQKGRLFELTSEDPPNHLYPAIVSPFIFGSDVAGVTLRYRLSENEKTCVLPNNSKTTLGMIGFSIVS